MGSSPTFETIRVNRNYYYSSGRKESGLSAGPDPCGIDEIGRHSGLRIRGPVRMGSSPLFRTKCRTGVIGNHEALEAGGGGSNPSFCSKLAGVAHRQSKALLMPG